MSVPNEDPTDAAKPKAESEGAPEVSAEPEVTAESEVETKPEVGVEPETEPEVQAELEPEGEAEPEAEPEVEPEPEGEPEVEPASAPLYEVFDCTSGDPALLSEAIDAAAAAIERGECIVLPTDTVYGIGADAFDPAAVQRLLDAKMRGRDMPPPVLISEPSLIRALAVEVPQQAKDLVAKHWPGPLTVICRMQPSLRMDLGETDGTIALRVPDHALTREILRRTGPLAVSSANISGAPAAVTCGDAADQLAESVAVYLDGGPLGGADAAPSTIVDFTQRSEGEILRHGALGIAAIREILPEVLDLVEGAPVESGPADDEESTEEPEGESLILESDPIDPEIVEAEVIEFGEASDPEPGPEPEPADDIVEAHVIEPTPSEPTTVPNAETSQPTTVHDSAETSESASTGPSRTSEPAKATEE